MRHRIQKSDIGLTARNFFRKRQSAAGFTLVELIVVITILAILATVGFLSLSGYSDDARTATVKANARTVYSAILTESTTSGNSPRYYVDHSTGAALSGAVAFMEGNPVILTGGQFGEPGTNYSAGNPRWDRLRMNGEKFKLAFRGFGMIGEEALAAYSTGELSVGAVDVFKTGANGRKRIVPFFQVTGTVSGSETAVVNGNYAPGTAAGIPSLVRDPSSTNPSVPLTETRTTITIAGNDGSGRKWSDGTVASTCFGYSSPPAGKAYAGSVGNGNYWIDTDGAGGNPEFQAYCDMTTDGGGWTLVSYAGTINGTPRETVGASLAEYSKPLFFDFGTYDPNAKTTRGSFSKVRQFRPLFSERTEYLARRTGNPDNMIVFPMPASKYASWFGRTEAEGEFTIPTDAYLPYLKMTNSGNSGWKTVTNNVFWSYDSSNNFPGINWNTTGGPGVAWGAAWGCNNSDGYGNYDTGLNHRSILYWQSAKDTWYESNQWFHAQPMSLQPSTGPDNDFQDFEFYIRN